MQKLQFAQLTLLCASIPSAHANIILDTLKGVDTSSVFDIHTSVGTVFTNTYQVGPFFTIPAPDPTLITEIGGFFDNLKLVSRQGMFVSIVGVNPDKTPDVANIFASGFIVPPTPIP